MTARRLHGIEMVIALGAIFAVGEGLHAWDWMVASGAIHFLAVGFITLATIRMFSSNVASDAGFRPMANAFLLSMAIFAATHAIEFLSYSIFPLGDHVESVVINELYMAALLAGTFGMMGLFRIITRKTHGGWVVMALLGANVLAAMAVIFPQMPLGMRATTMMENTTLLLLVIVFILVLQATYALQRRVTILAKFLYEVRIAYTVVVISVLPEAVAGWLGGVSIPGPRLELYSHYLFYVAMAAFFLSFDRLRMLGGIYAELEDGAS